MHTVLCRSSVFKVPSASSTCEDGTIAQEAEADAREALWRDASLELAVFLAMVSCRTRSHCPTTRSSVMRCGLMVVPAPAVLHWLEWRLQRARRPHLCRQHWDSKVQESCYFTFCNHFTHVRVSKRRAARFAVAFATRSRAVSATLEDADCGHSRACGVAPGKTRAKSSGTIGWDRLLQLLRLQCQQ